MDLLKVACDWLLAEPTRWIPTALALASLLLPHTEERWPRLYRVLEAFVALGPDLPAFFGKLRAPKQLPPLPGDK